MVVIFFLATSKPKRQPKKVKVEKEEEETEAKATRASNSRMNGKPIISAATSRYYLRARQSKKKMIKAEEKDDMKDFEPPAPKRSKPSTIRKGKSSKCQAPF